MIVPAEVLETSRLRIRPMSAGDFDVLLQGVQDPDRPWAEGYPLDESLVSAAMAQTHDPDSPWTQYQVILADQQVVVGDLTFLEEPDADRVALITFGIAPGSRGNGYATEALCAVVDWARARHDIRGLRADTDLVNPSSHHVLRAAGLHVVQDDGDRQVYELRWERRERIVRAPLVR